MNRKTTVLSVTLILITLALFAQPGGNQLKVPDAWVREVLPGQDMTAAYLVIENPGVEPDALLSASCDCAGTVEIHTMIHTDGKMKMTPVKRLDIPAGGKVALQPGGNHLMLFDAKPSLKAGAKANLALRFERAGEVKVEADVRAAEGKKDAH